MKAEVSLQKLFLVACILKITSSGIGWYIGSPWIFGLWVPIAFMIAYIVIGYYKREQIISDEKFADSCYYLGFIFTIASIIFALFDLKNIGTGLADIGIRFGAAMVSTCIGVAVRVALVNFRPNAEDALLNVEDTVVEVSRRLTNEFSHSFEELVDFRSKVMKTSKDTVAGVKLQIEDMSNLHRQQTEAFFEEMTRHNKGMIQAFIQELGTTAMGLAKILGEYESRAKKTADSIDQTVSDFTNVMVERLNKVEFPQDIFSRRLAAPIANLNDSTNAVADNVKIVSSNVKDVAKSVSTTVSKINAKAENLSEVLNVAQNLSNEQQELMSAMKLQQQSMLEQMKAYNTSLLEAISSQQEKLNQELKTHLSAVGGINETLLAVAKALGENKTSIAEFKQVSLNVSHIADNTSETNRAIVSNIDALLRRTEVVSDHVIKADETMASIANLLTQQVELHKDQPDTNVPRRSFRDLLRSAARQDQ